MCESQLFHCIFYLTSALPKNSGCLDGHRQSVEVRFVIRKEQWYGVSKSKFRNA